MENKIDPDVVITLIYDNNLQEIKELALNYGNEAIKCNHEQAELAPIHIAAGLGNTEIVSFFLNSPINEDPGLRRVNNFTPLHAAAMEGHTAVVKLLVEKGANVNEQTDPQKYAPVHSASFGGHLETIKLLVANGANLELKNYRDEKPIDTAKRQEQLAVVSYFEGLNS